MNVQVRTHRFDADKKLLDHVNEKVAKLQTYHDNIVDVEVYLKVDNVVHQIKDKIAEIKVHIPKHTFFVQHESKQFEESFDLAMKAVIDQIKSFKEKQNGFDPVASIEEKIEDDDDDYDELSD